jgi:beta-phosphoglucomutase
MLRTVIFDFDGVITDSEILHFRAFNQVLGQYGIELTKQEYYKTYLGFNDADCYGQLIQQGLLKAEQEQIGNLIEEKKHIYKELAKTEGKMIEGVREFLTLLEDNSMPMGICSGSLLTEVEMVLEDTGLRHLFEVIVSGEQVKKGKPDPEGFLLTLKRLNDNVSLAQAGNQNDILPGECIVIEDSHWGLEAAKAAGMHTIAVTNSYEAGQLGMAEKVVNQLNELSIDDLQKLCS